jgi:transposase
MAPDGGPIALQAQALALLECSIPIKTITELTGRSKSTIFRIRAIAKERGYDPAVSIIFQNEFFTTAPRSGRPITATTPENIQRVIERVEANRVGREMTITELGAQFNMSRQSAWRILHSAGYGKRKPTMKPGLTDAMKAARLGFALQHEHWQLEDWKNVIWTDETSIVLRHRRGSTRVWRKASQQYDATVIRARFKRASEFMFWGCFSYDRKGPMHIWKPETASERRIAQAELDALNAMHEPDARAEWGLATAMRRTNLRRQPAGRAPVWKFTAANGALVRTGKAGGIDWYRYGKLILLDKLLPFAKECQKDRPGTIIQEDKAPAHMSRHNAAIYSMFDIHHLLWPGNSPDLNMIEPAWGHLKRETTKKGAPRSRPQATERWTKAWKNLEQVRIQAWIKRIPRHIRKVIELDGDNKYREGFS